MGPRPALGGSERQSVSVFTRRSGAAAGASDHADPTAAARALRRARAANEREEDEGMTLLARNAPAPVRTAASAPVSLPPPAAPLSTRCARGETRREAFERGGSVGAASREDLDLAITLRY